MICFGTPISPAKATNRAATVIGSVLTRPKIALFAVTAISKRPRRKCTRTELIMIAMPRYYFLSLSLVIVWLVNKTTRFSGIHNILIIIVCSAQRFYHYLIYVQTSVYRLSVAKLFPPDDSTTKDWSCYTYRNILLIISTYIFSYLLRNLYLFMRIRPILFNKYDDDIRLLRKYEPIYNKCAGWWISLVVLRFA